MINRVMFKDKQIQVLILFFALFLQISIFSQDPEYSYVKILMTDDSTDESDRNPIKEIITEAISLEFELKNMKIIPVQMTSTSRLISKSKKKKTSYLIECLFHSDSNNISITVDCYRVENNVLIFSGELNSRIDLELDRAIVKSIKQLIEIIESDITKNPQLITFIEPDKKFNNATNDIKEFRHFSLTIGFSPFLTAGQASNYFIIGFVPNIHGQYRLKTDFGSWGLGWFILMNYFKAEGSSDSSENILLTTGPEIRLIWDLKSSLDFYFRLRGGPTLFMMNRNNEGYESTLLPFASGGLGIDINISELIGITVSPNYSIYFENSVFISGFSPSTGVYFSL